MILFSERITVAPRRPVAIILLGAIALAAIQLVPLPPSVWTALPGRAMFEQAAVAAGEPQPWRPLSIVPGATLNALFSLIVPLVTWLIVMRLRDQEKHRLPVLFLCLAIASTLLGLLQLTGGGLDHPLVNDTPGMVSGPFANRNHFAVFLACAILLIPSWAFAGKRRQRWRAPAGLALVTLFLLMILATGSRAGAAIGLTAVILGVLATRESILSDLRRHPRWISMALIVGAIATIGLFVVISITTERAASVDRALSASVGEDMRSLSLPVVTGIIKDYFPVGTGMGSFDPIFRVHEPFDLLRPTYFNHAHDDFLEIALDGGIAGILLLAAALAWLGVAGFRAWRAPVASGEFALGRLGSAMLFLILVASVFDYPARTPLFMAAIMIAASWLDDPSGSALPSAAR
ncbi:O-antigen ligase family protein [Sphingomonas lycopersici]|uniref:O-antigen ligase family protein n=1 Tax=Sphingomonas lycopersici TaxID=2951807 RepID=A0AA41ZHY7_9SPHN|nr:O-antigen ligase family protein [Sphingomonas lycopersici]MCW6537279.1 O-antigen ligase family protein [Sphingomonas lycopersici]